MNEREMRRLVEMYGQHWREVVPGASTQGWNVPVVGWLMAVALMVAFWALGGH